MNAKELLGTLSPVYGMATGKGLFGQAVGAIPAIAKEMRDDKEKEKERATSAAEEKKPATAMKKGGAVKMSSASKRADGCCIKGKTKGRMV
jgi:hypothetical protein